MAGIDALASAAVAKPAEISAFSLMIRPPWRFARSARAIESLLPTYREGVRTSARAARFRGSVPAYTRVNKERARPEPCPYGSGLRFRGRPAERGTVNRPRMLA